ncbi:MAG: sigma-70 family RNA polymerase sigma factor [Bacilli bacterium]
MNIDEIIKVNEKLIYKIASRFYNCDKEDLYQVGVVGLIKAIKNYKEDSNTKFTTYAYDYIFGEMFKLANENRTVKLNKDILKLYKKIETTRYLLAQKLGRFPSNQELALYLEVDESIIETTIMNAQSILSLDEQTKEEVDLYNKLSVEDNVALEDKIALKDSFNSLNSEEKKIINCRYFKDMTQSETAATLGLTQVMVSRYEKRSLDKMHNYLVS